MRPPVYCLALVLALGSCTTNSPQVPKSTTTLPPRLDSYFETYCDYTGNLGIGFVPSHTFDYRFRQHLKTTQDPELKRLYVLQHLRREVESELDDFEKGIVVTGMASERPLTTAEWRNTREQIQTKINDLAAYTAFTNFATKTLDPFDRPDPGLEASWIDELRTRLHNATNAPTQINSAR